MNADEIYQLIITGKIKIVDQTNGRYYNKCIYCKKIYESNNIYDWFCSKECYDSHNSENNISSCMEYYNDRKVKKCLLCGREHFYDVNIISKNTKNGITRFSLSKYICFDCQKIKDIINNTIYLKTCSTCGRTFSHNSEKWKWCSGKCNKDKLNQLYIKACQSCGKRFATRDLNIFYCSKGCAEKYHKGEGLIQKYNDIMTKKDY